MTYVYGAVSLKPGPQSQGIRAGRRIAEPAEPVPDGDVHAIGEDGIAACGLNLPNGFVWMDDNPPEWPTASFLDHCRACIVATR